ncbi:hypothetical protein WDW89_04375 [Deltaproteobacteria bacterium TL4]
MTQEEAIHFISEALKKALNKDQIHFSMETDLQNEQILDSLDAMAFLFELNELTGKNIPEDQDLAELGLLQVKRLVAYLISKD